MERDLRIAAYVDGELDPAERAAFETEMKSDPSLAGEVEMQRRLRARLAAAYDPVLDEPTPARLAAAAAPVARRYGAPTWAAMAACVVAGILVGRLALPRGGEAPFAPPAPRGELARVLDHGLTGDAGPIRVGLSFRDRDGDYCRVFASASDRVAGLACRTGDRWATRTLTAWAPDAGAAYRTAGSQLPPEVLAAVDGLIAGEPLDAAGEQTARAQGWRK